MFIYTKWREKERQKERERPLTKLCILYKMMNAYAAYHENLWIYGN